MIMIKNKFIGWLLSFFINPLELTAVFVEDEEEGGFVAYIAEMEGVITQGETYEEARENLLDAFKEFMLYKQAKIEEKLIKSNASNKIRTESLTFPKQFAMS